MISEPEIAIVQRVALIPGADGEQLTAEGHVAPPLRTTGEEGVAGVVATCTDLLLRELKVRQRSGKLPVDDGLAQRHLAVQAHHVQGRRQPVVKGDIPSRALTSTLRPLTDQEG